MNNINSQDTSNMLSYSSVLLSIEYLGRKNITLALPLPAIHPHEAPHLLHAWGRDVYGDKLYVPASQHHLDPLLVVLYLHQVSVTQSLL